MVNQFLDLGSHREKLWLGFGPYHDIFKVECEPHYLILDVKKMLQAYNTPVFLILKLAKFGNQPNS
jgi:hypothetical protein